MDSWLAFLIFLAVLNVYFLVLYLLVKTGWLARLNMSLFGPALMIKTTRGRSLLDWFAKARGFFHASASVGLVLTITMMVFMTLLLIVQVPFIFQLTPEQAPSPRLILGIPGVNPIIPLGYGIVALIFAVVVHEFSHGIMARVYQLRVKTMGILLLVIPIGAFVEPDEEELKRAPRRQRIRVFSAGPMSNIFFALLFAFLFSPLVMASVSPIPGAPIIAVEEGGPACQAGLLPGWVITHLGTNPQEPAIVRNTDDVTDRMRDVPPNATIYARVRDTQIPAGLDRAHPCLNETNRQSGIFPITTQPCQALYEAEACWDNGNRTGHPDPLNRSVIGFGPYPHHIVLESLEKPTQELSYFLQYLMLPFAAINGQFPLAEPYTALYETPFAAEWFWPVANTLYWLFWINLMLGVTNALPMVPLDGGHMFRDFIGGFLERRRPSISPERRDLIARKVSNGFALFLLILVLLQFVGPHIGGLFRA